VSCAAKVAVKVGREALPAKVGVVPAPATTGVAVPTGVALPATTDDIPTDPPAGTEVSDAANVITSALLVVEAVSAARVAPNFTNTADPTLGDVVTVDAVIAVTVPPVPPDPSSAACAGTTDKSPNPSEATAIADTFFNEIVFTIFLSFSQIKDDLLSGW
jgi:hypothetical protein